MTAPSPDAAPPSNKTALFVVFFVVFIDLLGFGIVLPLMPQFAVEFLGGYSDWERGLIIGALYSSFSLMQFVFSPLWGRWSDRVGRRPVLLISLTGSVVFYALFAFASTLSAADATLALALLLVARVGAGIAGASVSTASAVIADSTTPEKRSKGMALIGAAFGIGFTFGPLIALAGMVWLPANPDVPDQIAREWLWVPGGIASALSALALLIAVRKLPETRPLGGAPAHGPRGFSLGRSLAVLKLPAVGPFIVMYFLAIFAFANFEATLALYTKEVFLFDVRRTFAVFAGVGAVLMVAQGGVYRRLAGKVSDPALMTAGLVLMMVGLVGLGAIGYAADRATDKSEFVGGLRALFYLATAVAVFGFAFVNPSVAALVSKNADTTRQGEILGVNQSFAALGRILGPMAGSLLFFAHPSHALPFLAAGGVLVLVMMLLAGNARSRPVDSLTS